jgi:hypothetical protein
MAKKQIKGIKGWLLLIVLVLIAELILTLSLFYPKASQLYHGVNSEKLFFVVIIILVILFINALALIIFKSRYAPVWTVIALMYNIAFSISQLVVNSSPSMGETAFVSANLGMIIKDLLIILYFCYSIRVRNTFFAR